MTTARPSRPLSRTQRITRSWRILGVVVNVSRGKKEVFGHMSTVWMIDSGNSAYGSPMIPEAVNHVRKRESPEKSIRH